MATIPEYSIDTIAKGRQEYSINGATYEIVEVPANSIHALIDSTTYITSDARLIQSQGNATRTIYYSSASTLASYASTAAYGYNQTVTAPSLSNTTLTLKSPVLSILSKIFF